MPLTRREFLSKLATIAVVAPILPKILENVAPTPIVDQINAITNEYIVPALADEVFKPSPMLSLAMLEQAHQSLTYGYDEPDLIMMSPDVYSEFMQKWAELPRAARFQREDGELELPFFNGASVTHCNSLPKGSWMEINSNSLNPKLSGFFTKDKLEWQPIPQEIA